MRRKSGQKQNIVSMPQKTMSPAARRIAAAQRARWGKGQGCPKKVSIRDGWFGIGKFSPTKQHGDCEEIANPPTAFGRRRRNWIDAHGSVPEGQVVDASCGNKHCITLKHAYLCPRTEQPGVSQDRRPTSQVEGRSAL